MDRATQPDLQPTMSSERARQDAQIERDVAQVLSLRERLHAATAGESDRSRVLGIVAAARGAEQYLAHTIPDMIDQIAGSGRAAEIVIGLNNGFSCEPTLAYLETLPDVQVVRLYTGDKLGPNIPSASFADPARAGAPYLIRGEAKQHRIFALHQQMGQFAPGKIRMLNDICCGLLIPSILAGWRPPAYTIAFDAETRFIANVEDRNLSNELAQIEILFNRMGENIERVVNTLIQAHLRDTRGRVERSVAEGEGLERNGLRIIFDVLDNGAAALVGAITRFCTYDIEREIAGIAVRLPNLATPCSAMHTIYNYTCGKLPGCLCMPGGGTIGRTDCMLSLLGTIAEAYPGTTSEDAILTVLAAPAGFEMLLCDQVFMTNRCPGIDEWTSHQPPRRAWQQQFARWYAGFDAVEQLYGRHHATAVLGPSNTDFLKASLAVFWKTLRQSGDIPASLALLQQFASCGAAYEEIRALAAANPDVLVGVDGRPAWS